MSPSIDDQSDGAVIADVLAGRTQQFAILVRRYQRALLQFAKSRLGREDWAEDATQETFLSAYRSLSTYDSRYSFRTWLWTILLNQCRRIYEKQTRQSGMIAASGRCAAALMALPGEGDSPSAQLLAKERAARFEQLLRGLPEAQADALRLRFYADLKFQEIADAMGCSLSTAKNRVRWGLTKLSEQVVIGEML